MRIPNSISIVKYKQFNTKANSKFHIKKQQLDLDAPYLYDTFLQIRKDSRLHLLVSRYAKMYKTHPLTKASLLRATKARARKIWMSWSDYSESTQKCSIVSGSEGDNSPFRCVRPKLTSYLDYPYRYHTPRISWYPLVYLCWFNELKRFPSETAIHALVEICLVR